MIIEDFFMYGLTTTTHIAEMTMTIMYDNEEVVTALEAVLAAIGV